MTFINARVDDAQSHCTENISVSPRLPAAVCLLHLQLCCALRRCIAMDPLCRISSLLLIQAGHDSIWHKRTILLPRLPVSAHEQPSL